MGSEMCIRDSLLTGQPWFAEQTKRDDRRLSRTRGRHHNGMAVGFESRANLRDGFFNGKAGVGEHDRRIGPRISAERGQSDVDGFRSRRRAEVDHIERRAQQCERQQGKRNEGGDYLKAAGAPSPFLEEVLVKEFVLIQLGARPRVFPL